MRILVIVLDGVGIGALPDAADYNDAGADTLGHLDRALKFSLPNMGLLGLGRIVPFRNVPPSENPAGSWGKMAEASRAKDTVAGHWEMMGVTVTEPFRYFPEGFPPELLEEIRRQAGLRGWLGNRAASGTEIIRELGDEHLATGKPIVYTSADSVLQIAAHTGLIGLEELYKICGIARGIADDYRICRVIARPFRGNPGEYSRVSEARRDYAMPPFAESVPEILEKAGIKTTGVGKISTIFAGKGISESLHSDDNADGMRIISGLMRSERKGLIFANLVDFDMLFGHRNDAPGFAAALARFDAWLGTLLPELRSDDLLAITADHGCDPLFPTTNHTREYVPLLVYGRKMKAVDLGVRASFADLGATILDYFGIDGSLASGKSFLGLLTAAR